MREAMWNPRKFAAALAVCLLASCVHAGVAPHLEAVGRIELDSWRENQGRAKVVIESVYRLRGSERTLVTPENEQFNCLSTDGNPGELVTLPVNIEIFMNWQRIRRNTLFGRDNGKYRCASNRECVHLDVDLAGLAMDCGAREEPMFWVFKEQGKPVRSLGLLVTAPKKNPWIQWFVVKDKKKRSRMAPLPSECTPRVTLRFSWSEDLIEKVSKGVVVEIELEESCPAESVDL